MLQIKTDLYRYVHYTSNVAVCNYQELIGCDVSFMVVLISERHGGLFCNTILVDAKRKMQTIFIILRPAFKINMSKQQLYWVFSIISLIGSIINS